MSTKTYDFTDAADYNFTDTDIKVEDGAASLKLGPYPNRQYSEDFSSSVGFDVPATAEFVGGQLQQVDTLEGATLASPFTTDENATSGVGDLTGTLENGATVENGRLNLGGASNKYLSYNAVGKINASKGSVRFKFIPDFDGNIGGELRIFTFAATPLGANDFLYLYQDGASAIRVTSKTSAGAALQTATPFGTKPFVKGQVYDISYSWDFIAGRHEVFIDGAQQGGTQLQTGVRSNDLTTVSAFTLGYPLNSNAFYDDLLIYPDVKFTSAPSTPYSIPEFRYPESYIQSPLVNADGSPDGTLLSVEVWTVTGSANTRFTFNSPLGDAFWYKDLIWVPSDKSYAQSNTPADIIDHLEEFPFDPETTTFKYGIVFPDSVAVMEYITQLDVTYTHQIYKTTNPVISIANDARIWSEEMYTLLLTIVELGLDKVRFTQVIGGTKTWFTTVWEAANNTYAQTNSAAEVLANWSTLIDSRSQWGLDIWLHSEDGLTTPKISLFEFTYDAALSDPTNLPRLVDVNGYVYGKSGAKAGIKVEVRPYTHGFNNRNDGAGGGVFQIYDWETLGTTVADGYFSGNMYLQPDGEKWEFRFLKKKYYTELEDKDANDINELTFNDSES